MRKKSVIFVAYTLSGGGAERVVSVWASELKKLGHDVTILVFFRNDNEYPVFSQVPIIALAHDSDNYKRLSKLDKIRGIRSIIKNVSADFVIPFAAEVGLVCQLAKIGLRTKMIETIRIAPQFVSNNIFFRMLRDISVAISFRCIVQNNQQSSYFPKWIQKKIAVFANPISDQFVNSSKIIYSQQPRKIITCGRLAKQKNQIMLVEAVAQLHNRYLDITLEIYGTGDYEKILKKRIHELGSDSFIFLMGRSKYIEKKLVTADIFVLPSDFEGMPNALMEAMAVGLPCISTDCDYGPSDIISDNDNGYLIPVGDKEMLIQRITDFCENPQNAEKMARKARARVCSEFSAQNSARQVSDYFQEIK